MGAAEDAKTSGLAITALVLMVLSVFTCGLTALPALICGIIALVKIGNSGGQLKGKGFAIAGIVAPVVMIPIMAMQLAIMMPALSRTKVLAQRLVCGTNIHGLGSAMQVYAFDYNDKFPTGSKWCDLLVEQVDVSPKSLVCPGAVDDSQCNYAMNENTERLGKDVPDDMVLLFETSESGWNVVGGKELLSTDNHRGDGCNVLFADGHSEFVRTENLDTLKWTRE
jgi:prepilin-type processing-associated H-X9-DG protein